MSYTSASDSTVEKLKELSISDDGWTSVGVTNGVTIHSKHVEGTAIVMMRGVCEMAASADAILACTEDYEGRSTWDDLFLKGEVVDTADETHQLIHFQFKSPSMMVTKRDFLMARTVLKEEGGILSNHVSVEDEKCPDCKGFVRGDVFASGYYIQPSGEGSKVTYVVQIDPKGWIPTPVVNSVAKKQPMVLAKMRDFLQK